MPELRLAAALLIWAAVVPVPGCCREILYACVSPYKILGFIVDATGVQHC